MKNHLKKLQKQKNCYEEVVGYFRDEMNIMAEQLHNLQELLVGFLLSITLFILMVDSDFYS